MEKIKNHRKNHFQQTSIFAKMLVFLLIFSTESVLASSYSQTAKFSFDLKNSSLRELFSQIEQNSEYTFLYKANLPANTKINLKATNETLDKILDKALIDTDISYKINDKQVLVYNKKLNPETTDWQQTPGKSIVISGTVKDNNGETLPGVSIMVDDTNISSVTDIEGNFTVSVPNENSVIIFSYLGFKRNEVKPGTERKLLIVLEEDTEQLEEVVVVGYGTQKKASVVGSVSSIQAKDLKVPSTQLSNSFAGRLPGITAVQRSGQPGSNASQFWVRGVSTFGGSTGALIIVDGVEVSSGDLNNISPDIIADFSILKDATATALYGTRGANGVLIVNTKNGKEMVKPQINIRLENAVNTPIKTPNLTDGVTYMKMYNEAVLNRGTGEVLYPEHKIQGTIANGDPLLYPNVNWYDELFKNTSMTQNLTLNITGGTNKVDYFMNATVNHENGMLQNRSKEFATYNNNINLWRYNFQNNLRIYPTKTTTIGLRINAQIRNNETPSQKVEDLFSNVMSVNPVDFPVYFPASDPRENVEYSRDYVAWGGASAAALVMPNPVAQMARGYSTNFQSTVIANFDVNQKLDFITKGLSAYALASFKNWNSTTIKREAPYNMFYIKDYTEDENYNLTNYTLQSTSSPSTIVLGTSGSTSGDRSFYLQGQLNYSRTFEEHNVGAMLLYNQTQYDVNNPSNLNNSLPKRKQGLAGRVNYVYGSRYLAEANFGYNGSENFAEGNRFGFFPSFALGYVLSEESYWEPLKNAVSFFKIRGSWGKVGNDQIILPDGSIPRFLYMSDVTLQSDDITYTTGYDQGYTLKGPKYNRFGNPDITWEIGEKINIGIDMQLFKYFNVMIDVFREHRRNIFMERKTIPTFLGTAKTKIYGNLGEVENKGLDGFINFDKPLSQDIFLSIKGTFTFAQNKILSYDDPAYLLYPNLSRVGHAIHQPQLYIAERLFIDDAEVRNSSIQQLGSQAMAGDIKYRDLPNANGVADGNIDANDRLWTGYPTIPEITYGIGASMTYKKFDLSFLLQGVGRTSLIMSSFHPFGSSNMRNVLQWIADDYWSPTNQNIYASYPRLSKQDPKNNSVSSTYWSRDASFLKLKNMELGYSWKFVRIYINATNLLTLSKFKYWDPEQGGGAGFNYPTQKTFNIGLQLNM